MSDLHEQLAKLMATENIDVVYSVHAKTASFNLQTRVLTLPVYEDLPEECLSLLVYHEVGHALFTPLNATQEAYNQVAENDLPLFRNILNIVEDVRIEKLIQKKYPGTTPIFKKGYYLFDQKSFFATKNRKKFSFLDKINLYFAVGLLNGKPITFTEEEAPIVARIDKSLEFSSTLQIAFDIFSFLKQKQQEKENQLKEEKQAQVQLKARRGTSQNCVSKPANNLVKEKNYDDDSELQSEDSQNSPNNDEESEDANGNLIISDGNNESDNATNNDSDDKLSVDDIVSCASKDNFEEQLQSNLMENRDDTEIKYYYIDEDTLTYKDVLIDYKELYKLFDESNEIQHARTGGYREYYKEYINKLLHETKQTISSMASIFEMKKQALLHTKDTTHCSGSVLDCNKLFQYKYNEDIFKKYNISFNGKNHGMVMFLDCSGSMRHTMKETLQQVLSLVLFCRKVNIPFEVYGFSSKYSIVEKTKAFKKRQESPTTYFSDDKIDNIAFAHLALKEYFSYKMSKAEFDKAVWIFCYMIMAWDKNLARAYVPSFEYLDETPLDSTILASKYIINEFKKETNTEVVNAIYLTDGQTTYSLAAISKCDYKDENITRDISHASFNTPIIILRNKKTKDELVFKRTTYQQRRDGMSYLLYNLVKKDTGANIINIYLSQDKNTTHHILRSILKEDKIKYDYVQKLINDYSKNNIIVLNKKDTKAFDSMFVLRVKAFANVDVNDIAVSDNKRTYINNYAKVLGKRFSNRIFVNSFTDIICKNIM